jgi:hypothetical protein
MAVIKTSPALHEKENNFSVSFLSSAHSNLLFSFSLCCCGESFWFHDKDRDKILLFFIWNWL